MGARLAQTGDLLAPALQLEQKLPKRRASAKAGAKR
jgi:hypothetical protein